VAGVRRAFHWLHLIAGCLVVVGVVVQVYLAGAVLFGATDIDNHKNVGFMVHNVELAVFVFSLIAWLPKWDIAWSFLLAAVGTGQVAFSAADEWVGALHPVFALVVFIIAAVVVYRDLLSLGLMRKPAAL
jgi:hypothetical protein